MNIDESTMEERELEESRHIAEKILSLKGFFALFYISTTLISTVSLRFAQNKHHLKTITIENCIFQL